MPIPYSRPPKPNSKPKPFKGRCSCCDKAWPSLDALFEHEDKMMNIKEEASKQQPNLPYGYGAKDEKEKTK